MKIKLHKWFGKAIIAAILLATPLSTYAQISAGNALSFDGDTDYVSLGNSAALEPTSTLTIELWVNPAIISDQRDLITSGIDGAGIKGYHLSIQNDGKVYLNLELMVFQLQLQLFLQMNGHTSLLHTKQVLVQKSI